MRALRTLVIALLFVLAVLLGVLAFVDNSSAVALEFLEHERQQLLFGDASNRRSADRPLVFDGAAATGAPAMAEDHRLIARRVE